MKPSDIRLIEFIERLPVDDAKIEHVAIYNDAFISDERVHDLIRTGDWVHNNPSVIFTTKTQYENVFGPVPQPK